MFESMFESMFEFEMIFPLIIGFAFGYGVREWQSQRRRSAYAARMRSRAKNQPAE